MPPYIWIRCGDLDDYHHFETMYAAAEYLASMLVSHPLKRHVRLGVRDKHYKGENYISLYWGGNKADDVQRDFTDEELAQLNIQLERAIKERD